MGAAVNVERLKAAVLAHGFRWFDRGAYNLNLIGVRAAGKTAGLFDDALYCAYKVERMWRLHRWVITTDPGTRALARRETPTAILVSPQQCTQAYKIGLNRGRYPTLVQRGRPVLVWRDGNSDRVLDWGEDSGVAGWYGINIHRSQELTNRNTSASYGCQVFAVAAEHMALMALARQSVEQWGPRITYTLIDEADL